MGGLLHLVQRGGDWAGPQPAQAPPRCTKYIHLYSPERQQQQVKKAPNTQQKQTNKRERKNYAQIGQASEQCYHQRTLKTSVNQR